MSLTSQLDRYLAVRRSLGYDLSTSERILRRFTRFADRERATHIDTAYRRTPLRAVAEQL
ncbi:hypothetical protein [Bradyrhizobium sp. Ai1a-2]|uniref:hypothetical protein n=1 Tax=Bradyrhizobium sp. Ai1a-2 TaxID=196490 RepID=UPI00041FBA84|nr:hypothetical protein [Bradyrhizobium sp. Ai1a-2]